MSDKAEQAWAAWRDENLAGVIFSANGGNERARQLLVEQHYAFTGGWDAGYTAATADCEATVRAAVEATIAEAITANCKWCREGYALDYHEATGYPYHVLDDRYDDDYPECQSAEIRALDASAIVARVMHKEEQ